MESKKKYLRTGISVYRKHKKSFCERCKSKNFLGVHHIDGDRFNNKKNNLETLCRSCHTKEHKVIKNFREAYKIEPRNSKGRFGKDKPIGIIYCINCGKKADKENPKQKYCEKCKILLNTRHLKKEELAKC